MIISFAWTTPALLAGAKTMTRRDWTGDYARRFRAGMLVDAYDRSPRARGRKVATIRLTRAPRREWSTDLTEADYDREGFTWLRAHGDWETVDRVMRAWGEQRRLLWVVEFELVEVLGSSLPRQGAVRSGENEPAADQHFSSRRGTDAHA